MEKTEHVKLAPVAAHTTCFNTFFLTLSNPCSSSFFPKTSPIPDRAVTDFSPIGSPTKSRCFWDVVDILAKNDTRQKMTWQKVSSEEVVGGLNKSRRLQLKHKNKQTKQNNLRQCGIVGKSTTIAQETDRIHLNQLLRDLVSVQIHLCI